MRDRGVGMTIAEVARLLDEVRTATLATIGPDGRPHLAAMWFVAQGIDVLLWTYASSQKARNLERDPRAGVLAETGTGDYSRLRGASLDCDVEIVRDPDRVLEVGRRLNDRYSDGTSIRAETLARQAARRVALVCRTERVRSWDHGKLAPPST